MPQTRPIRGELDSVFAEIERLTEEQAAAIVAIDIGSHRDRVNAVLSRASELARADTWSAPNVSQGSRAIRPGADLIGSKLAGHDLRGANLRGAYLIAADLRRTDLRGADLRGADLRGADLRDADLSAADVSASLFLTQSQLNAAKGDAETKVPTSLTRPTHWAS